MCGIAGAYAYDQAASPVDKEELLKIRDAMARRGPDGEGLWMSEDGRAGLAHRRLAIIDLSSAGAQPMASGDGRYQITFNGEIYNYREIRKRLEHVGRIFRSNSDTEVLLHLYEMSGESMLGELRGMYAFAIFDSLKRSLFLARDPFGIKPLYYADDGKTFRFASQVKALCNSRHVDTSRSAAGHVGFYLWGHIPDPHTLFKGIRAVKAGTYLTVAPTGPGQPETFFSIAREYAEAGETALEVPSRTRAEMIRAALVDSIRHHLVSDVPVGMFLSAGVDSATLTALAAEAGGGELRSVTLGFKEFRGTESDETPLASLVARRYGASHETSWISRNDFAIHVEEILDAMDQPSIDGVNTFFVSRAAAQQGMKVAISGVGGDELFGGYPSFRDLPLMTSALRVSSRLPRIGRGFRWVSAPLLKWADSPKYAGLLEYGGTFGGAYLLRRGLYMPWELPDLLDPDLAREGWDELRPLMQLEETIAGLKTDFQKVSALELGWYMRNQLLRDADWAGMAHSLEIRLPLVDVDLLRAVAPFAATRGVTKREMAQAPAKALPAKVVERRKTGFSVPVGEWLQRSGTSQAGQHPKGIRRWACRVLSPRPRKKRVLALVTDAFGGHGGIAKFNRDFLTAVCTYPSLRDAVVLPRVMVAGAGKLPDRLVYVAEAAGSKVRFLNKLLVTLARRRRFDVVICGHLNLTPVAWIASVLSGGRLVLVIHGIDAWNPSASAITNLLQTRIDTFISVSALTRERFISWTGLNHERFFLVPNSIDLGQFRPMPKRRDLKDRFGLEGRVVVMTMGRLISAERYKGFDEILEILPVLAEQVPNVVYLIAGEGDDRSRLHAKAERLGIGEKVVFTGFVPEEDKVDYFNLADAFVMPSRGEGFGIVFLEAMACGVPVVGSALDGSREALRDGQLGEIVDPGDASELLRATVCAIRQPKSIPRGLEYFSSQNFERRVHDLMDRW